MENYFPLLWYVFYDLWLKFHKYLNFVMWRGACVNEPLWLWGNWNFGCLSHETVEIGFLSLIIGKHTARDWFEITQGNFRKVIQQWTAI
jgi:hypothetical protein